MLLEMIEAERVILASKKFLRLSQISLAVDYTLQSDTAQSRYTHSIEVANAVQIMNYSISKKLGFDINQKGAGRIIGLLHDIGHTCFGHLGEKMLNKLTLEYSEGKFSFEGNSNNYVTIEKNELLKGLSRDSQSYILASLAKHPEELYEEQAFLEEIIKEACLEDTLYFRENGFKLESTLSSTIQCQIMDVADENCYIISDIVDSLNILSKKELKEIFIKEIPLKYSEDFIMALNKGKNEFRKYLQGYFIKFVENFNFNSKGILIPLNKDLEELRLILAKINRTYVLGNQNILILREKNAKMIEEVFRFHFENKGLYMPSSFYLKKFNSCSTNIEKLKIIRNMCGSFTDKGLKTELKRIKKIKGE
jgi:dGTP triphosphohydrolase